MGAWAKGRMGAWELGRKCQERGYLEACVKQRGSLGVWECKSMGAWEQGGMGEKAIPVNPLYQSVLPSGRLS